LHFVLTDVAMKNEALRKLLAYNITSVIHRLVAKRQ